jgi:hypothetical protein
MTRSLTRRAPIALLAAGSLVVGACGGDDDDATTVTPGEVEVTDPGSETGRIELPGTAEVGQTGTASATVSSSAELSGPIDEEIAISVRLDYSMEIVSADADGYVVETEFTGGETLDAPAGADVDVIGDIVGVRYRQSFAADGTTGEAELVDADRLTTAQRGAFEEFGSQLQTTSFSFPSEPVGEGATWTAVATIENQGIQIEVPYEYELTSVEGDDYEIEIAYDTEVDERMSFDGSQADVSGTVSGGGTTRGSVTNPLLAASTIDQEIDFDVEAEGETLGMSIGIALEVGPS